MAEESSKEYDVIIIGAGIFGLATGYHIVKQDPKTKCLIIDMGNEACSKNTQKSTALYRVVFSSQVNRHLATATVSFFEYLHRNNIDIGLREFGYLWLLSKDKWKDMGPIINEIKKEGQTEIQVFSAEELKSKIETLNLSPSSEEDSPSLILPDVYKGVYFKRCGSIEPKDLGEYYRQQYEQNGELMLGCRVLRIIIDAETPTGFGFKEPTIWQIPKVKGVELESGDIIRAKCVIVSAGAWTPSLLDPLGIDSYVKAKKRQTFQIQHKSLTKFLNNPHFSGNSLPFIILPYAGVHVKPNPREDSVWVGSADDIGRPLVQDPDELEEPQPEADFYMYGIQPILAEYFPIFKSLPLNLNQCWAGHYIYNTIDKNPYVFRTNLRDVIVCTGGSGSGLMKSDSIGRITAALFFDKEEATLFDGTQFLVKRLGVKNRDVDEELLAL